MLLNNDYVKRSDVMQAVCSDCYCCATIDEFEDTTCPAKKKYMSIPAADVEPVRHGRWEYDSDGVPICSQCGEFALQRLHLYIKNKTFDAPFKLTDYCPNCGAKMNTERVEE